MLCLVWCVRDGDGFLVAHHQADGQIGNKCNMCCAHTLDGPFTRHWKSARGMWYFSITMSHMSGYFHCFILVVSAGVAHIIYAQTIIIRSNQCIAAIYILQLPHRHARRCAFIAYTFVAVKHIVNWNQTCLETYIYMKHHLRNTLNGFSSDYWFRHSYICINK